MERKIKVGDEIWTFSTLEPKIIGPLVVNRVLPSGQAHHYYAIEPGSTTVFYLRNNNAGTRQKALRFCIDYWENQIHELRSKADELEQEVNMLIEEVV